MQTTALKNILILFLSMISLSVSAQLVGEFKPVEFSPIYPQGEIPNSKATGNEQEISTQGNDGIERISNVSIPTMRYYTPNKEKFKGTAIIICPGGGYAILAMSHEGDAVAKQFAANGIAAFVLKYRLPSDAIMEDKSIAPLQDAQQAIKRVRESATAYGIDPHKIGIIGFSAGGHVASSAGVHFTDAKIDNPNHTSLRPDFMLLIYPVISMDTAITHMGSRNNLLGKSPSSHLVHYFSNETQITEKTPPTLLVHAADDHGVSIVNSERFHEQLEKRHIPTRLIIYPQGGHGFGLHNKTTDDKWFDHALEWLHEVGY